MEKALSGAYRRGFVHVNNVLPQPAEVNF